MNENSSIFYMNFSFNHTFSMKFQMLKPIFASEIFWCISLSFRFYQFDWWIKVIEHVSIHTLFNRKNGHPPPNSLFLILWVSLLIACRAGKNLTELAKTLSQFFSHQMGLFNRYLKKIRDKKFFLGHPIVYSIHLLLNKGIQ